jgi:hypothetical protein
LGQAAFQISIAAQTIFGSNLLLHHQKIEFTPTMQWAALSAALQKYSENPDCNILVNLYDTARTYFMTKTEA